MIEIILFNFDEEESLYVLLNFNFFLSAYVN